MLQRRPPLAQRGPAATGTAKAGRQALLRRVLAGGAGIPEKDRSTMVGWLLSGIVVLGLLVVGTGALVAPRVSSAQYGIVSDDPRALAFVRAMGVRDVVIGVLLGLLIAVRAREALALAMFAAALIAVVDFALVSTDPQPRALSDRTRVGFLRPRVLHLAGALLLLGTGVVLYAGP